MRYQQMRFRFAFPPDYQGSDEKRKVSFATSLKLHSGRFSRAAVYFLVVVWSCAPVARPAFGFPQTAKASTAPKAAASVSGTVTAIAGQGQANNLAGITVDLNDPATGSTLRTTSTDDNGRYQFSQLPPGTYTLDVRAEGFKPWSGTITLAENQSLAQNAALEINAVNEKIEVQGENLEISTAHADTTETVTDRQLDTLPLPQEKFTEALPLTPGVIRTTEGKLNFNGQAENQGILLVNSTETVDPATGSFAIPVPIDVIQSMSVHTFPDTAEFGGFSGGLTEIDTKPPLDAWNFRLHNMTPSFRGKNGHLVGVGFFNPRVVFGGPLIKGKLNFTEELTYESRDLTVRGLPWPVDETKTRSVTSFTQFEYIVSPRHLLDVSVNVFPLRTQFANINALVPQSASSDYGQNGASVSVADSYQLESGGVLNTSFRYTRFDSHAHGQGPEDMLVTPEGWSGNYFNTWSRDANELEFRPAFQFADKNWHGRHVLKIGVDVSHRSFDGTSASHPVQVLRENGTPAEQIDFQGPGLLNAETTETGEFVEDHWILNSRLALDMGARISNQTIGRGVALGPHIGFAYSPTRSEKTVIRAGAGTVYGHVPLLAASFLDNPTRVISYFDPSGAIIGQPSPIQNFYLVSNGARAPQLSTQIPGTSPRTFTWSAEVEHEFRKNMSLRVSYLDSQTRNLFAVEPFIGATATASSLALANSGSARYRRVETNLHLKPFERGELNVTYVWSHSYGDLNTLSDVYMPFEQPVIRPNATGVLPADVPNRLLTSGIFQLPFKLTLSPVVEVRTGLPYSEVDTLQNYVGVPNSFRFPTFFSLDARIYREFPLHIPFREKSATRKIRIGVYSVNLTNHRNFLDVYNNVDSPLIGQFAGLARRFDGLIIDLVD